MSTNALFIKSKWVSLGKKWGDIPPIVKCTGKKEFLIPTDIGAKILPPPGFPIQKMLAFALPIQGTTVNSIDPMNFFSHNALELITEASLTCLRQLPMPTPLMVGQLVELQGQAWLDGFQSVRYTHLSNAVTSHFPFWLVSFWAATLNLHKNVYKPWITAREWINVEVQKNRSPERHQLAEDTRAFMAVLPWDNEIVQTMWRYLGPHMTTSSQQNDMLDTLSDHITAQPELADRMHVNGLALSAKIMEAAVVQDGVTYQTAQSFRWIWNLGNEIVQRKQCILTKHHLGKE
jgi:hypothetical protein